MLDLFLFAIALIILWKSSDAFVDSSQSLALHLKLPPILIGATVVAFGTSAPELFVAIFAGLNHQSDVIYGNIFGSNIANVFLIFAISLILKRLDFDQAFHEQLHLNLLSLVIVFVSVCFFSPSRFMSILILIVFAGIQFLFFKKKASHISETPPFNLKRSVAFFLLSLFLLIFSSRLLVLSLINVATFLGLSTTFLSLFLVAFGTSLPELVTTMSFVRKNHIGIVVGNVFGSNLFNLLFVLPMAWLVHPANMASHFYFELTILFVTILFMMVASYCFKQSRPYMGWFLLVLYFIYLSSIFYFVS
jgi:cation:H+ antiporter